MTIVEPVENTTATRTGAALELRDVAVTFDKTDALHDCSFAVSRGETLALLGPSGSGKSTALNAIAGFTIPSRGQVLLSGRDVTGLSPAKRGIGIVVQSYALFPHMSVRSNVAFGLKSHRVSRADIRPRVDEALRMVGMLPYADRYPAELSGGQQQRVSIARSLAIRPNVLLLDEPLSALDARLRQEMLAELQALRENLPDVAMVYVTHDQQEALALAGRIAIMRNSTLEAIGPTADLFNAPPSEFVATFLGGADILPAVVQRAAAPGGPAIVTHGDKDLQVRAPRPLTAGAHVSLAVRPWSWRIAHDEADRDVNALAADVRAVQWRGSQYAVSAELITTGLPVHVDVPVTREAPQPGARVWVSVRPQDLLVVPAEKSA